MQPESVSLEKHLAETLKGKAVPSRCVRTEVKVTIHKMGCRPSAGA